MACCAPHLKALVEIMLAALARVALGCLSAVGLRTSAVVRYCGSFRMTWRTDTRHPRSPGKGCGKFSFPDLLASR